ncbi:MAG: M48 family metallopeptidase [Candidatus Thermoplasmatota archaeon]|nr:M48 family metallopeptidase [Candidatus Thermoplasmatota archaeon]
MDYEIEHPDIGIIRYIKNNRAKRIVISVKPNFVRVTVPRRQTLKNAQKFVEQKIDWIKTHSKNMQILREKSEELPKIKREEAREKLGNRLSELAQKHNFQYNRVSIRNQRTRWGSCSSKDNISLNMKLLHLPEHLIDYILLHELVHTRVKNHSKSFWDELETVVPNARSIDKQLREYQYCLF